MRTIDRTHAIQLYQSQQALVDRFLVRSLRRFPKLRQMPTLRSHLEEALWRTALRFDPSQGAQFATFAYHRLHGCVLDLVRKRCRSKEPFICNIGRQVEYEPSQRPDPRSETICPEHKIDIERTVHRIRKILATVEPLSQDIVIQHIAKGQSLRSIARDLELSYSEVRRRYQNALTVVRQKLDYSTSSSSPIQSSGRKNKSEA
ncbi:MAG: hypothetical protein CMH54_02260 [Myxococcales bacterium]|nr:hypothetical protein [Myxococcales bacterium]